jgi:hypothetical protein
LYGTFSRIDYKLGHKQILINLRRLRIFVKIREQEGRTGPVWRGLDTSEEEDVRKGCRSVNMVQILYLNVCI